MFGWVKKNFRVINMVSGGILVVFGVLLITNNVTRISNWIVDVMDSIGLGGLTAI